MVHLICAGKDSGRVDKQVADGRPGVGLIRTADRTMVCPSAVLQTRPGVIPANHKLSNPPTPSKSGIQMGGGGGAEGSDSKRPLGGSFCLTK